ncbi:amino acid permease [Alicyclobacillus tolerans]|uniref:APC family permease n=1 Tax=Alicyclobacillus tolerans TaxID=90970 RepID=UPI001F00BDB6|nr:amino acid permease [Alicyclobacillus tolerans]MCF8565142.1 amino acid permease [Alicyclobacillus tolerans]
MERQHEHSLRRSLTWVQGTPMTIGAVLGSGILVLPSLTAGISGPAAIIAWLVMAFLSFPLALTLGGLAAQLPSAGGIAAYSRKAFGPRFGGMVGWLFLGTIPLGVPIVALIGSNYMGIVLGLTPWQVTALAAVLLAISVSLNIRGIELSGWVQVLIIALIAILLTLAIFAALPHVHGSAFHPFAPKGWWTIGRSAEMIFWCFVGWEMIAHLAEEFTNPRRDVVLSLGLAALAIALLYLGVTFVTIGTHAYGGQTGLAPLSTLVGIGIGRAAASLTAVLALLISFATVHTNIAGFSRMVFAQAREGEFPGVFAKLHAKHQTPYAALLGMSLVFAFVLLANVAFHPNLGMIIKWPSAIFVTLYIVATASGVRLFRRYSVWWWMSFVSLALSIGIYLFSGWAMLFPIILGSLGWGVARRRPRPSVNPLSKSV